MHGMDREAGSVHIVVFFSLCRTLLAPLLGQKNSSTSPPCSSHTRSHQLQGRVAVWLVLEEAKAKCKLMHLLLSGPSACLSHVKP